MVSQAAPQKLTAISKLRHEQQEVEFPDLDLQPLPSGGQGYRRSQEKQSRHARPKTKDVAAKIEKALDRHERCAVRHHRRCHLGYSLLRNRTALATEGSHDIAWHQRNPFVLPLLGLGCGCLAGDGFCAARLSDARFANDLGWRSRGPSLQDKEIKYLLAVRGAIQTALELTSYQTRCARTLKRLRRAPPIITPRLGDGRAGLPCSQ